MRVLCRNLIVLHFQRETLTKYHNRAADCHVAQFSEFIVRRNFGTMRFDNNRR